MTLYVPGLGPGPASTKKSKQTNKKEWGDERKWDMKYEWHLIKEFSMKNVVPRKKNLVFYILY